MNWKKAPSVTPGGKLYFFNAYAPDGRWLASIVWDREVRAYKVQEAEPGSTWKGRTIGYVSTVAQGKKLAQKGNL